MKKFIAGAVLALVFAIAAPAAGTLGAAAATPTMNPTGPADYNLVDVNQTTTVTDWSQVASQVIGVYIKATGGNTDAYTNPQLDSQARGALNAGLDVGFYHYLYAHDTTDDAAMQADLFYNHISQYSYDLVPVLDVEETNGESVTQLNADVKAFAEEFNSVSGGQDLMIYSNVNFINSDLDPSLVGYKLWVAHYTTASEPYTTNVWNSWTMWQYSSTGTVAGISGAADLDRATDGIFLNGTGSSGTGGTSTGGTGTSGTGTSGTGTGGTGTGTGTTTPVTVPTLTVDPHYSVNGSVKSVSATAALDGGNLLVVTTLSDGSQTVAQKALTADAQPYVISVGTDAVKSTVYLIKGQFNGAAIPQTLALAQFVAD